MKDKKQEFATIANLVEQMKNGDETAFASFYTQTYKYVYSRAKSMFSDEGEALDLVQEVYLAFYRNVESIESSENIFGWLKTTTFYQGTKMLQKRRKEVLLTEEGKGMFESIPDDEQEIEEDYMNKEDVEVIRECINRLSDEQKTVLLAYYYDNLKVNEIAEIFSVSEGTVKSRLYLARKNLRAHVEGEEKKRGYKLHSFGAVTLALALRAFLQTNMETAVAEETVFAKLCEAMKLSVVNTSGAQSLVSSQVSKEGPKKVGKKLFSRIAELGAKKIALTASGIVAATVIGGAAIGGLNKENNELQKWQVDYAHVLFELICAPDELQEVSMSDALFQEDMDEYMQQYYEYCHDDVPEKIQLMFGLANKDAGREPELIVEFRSVDGKTHEQYMFKQGNSLVECYGGKIDYDDGVELYELHMGNVIELLDVQISEEDSDFLTYTYHVFVNRLADYDRESIRGMQFAKILFDDNEVEDYVFLADAYVDVLNPGFSGDETVVAVLNESTERCAYVEKQATIIEHDYYDEYDARDKMTTVSVKSYRFNEAEKRLFEEYPLFIRKYRRFDNFNNPIIEYEKRWIEDEKFCWGEITEAEYTELYNEICKDEIDLIKDVKYRDVLDIIYDIPISLGK